MDWRNHTKWSSYRWKSLAHCGITWHTMLRPRERHTTSHGYLESYQSSGHWVCRDSSASSTSSWRTLCLLPLSSKTCLWPVYLSELLVLSWNTCWLVCVFCQLHDKPWPPLSTTSIRSEAGYLGSLPKWEYFRKLLWSPSQLPWHNICELLKMVCC